MMRITRQTIPALLALVAFTHPARVLAGLPQLPGGRDSGGEEAQGESGATVQRRQYVMGTWLDVEVRGRDRAQALAAAEAAIQVVEATDRRLSTWREDSELAAANRDAPRRSVEISRKLAQDLSEAMQWSHRTIGAFNPAMGSLVAVWDLRGPGKVPEVDELSDALAASRCTDLILQDHQLRFARPGLTIEEGGFGKGAALRDGLAAALVNGAICVGLDFGGQVAIGGVCGSKSIGVASPRDRTTEVAILSIASGSVATSGLSERNIVVDGFRYGHIVDPRDGRPSRDWGAVTVFAADPFGADCVSTALYVMGPDAGAEWTARQPDIEALFVEVSNETVRLKATEGLRSRLFPRLGHEIEWIPDVDIRHNEPQETLNRAR